MSSPASGKKVILVIASEGFQAVEYGVTKKLLEDQGVVVVTASNEPGGAVAHDETTAEVDLTIDQVKPSDYDGLFLIGGPGAMEQLDNSTTYKVVSAFRHAGKPYGAICVSPRILAKANAIEGVKVTCWDGDKAARGILTGFKADYQEGKDIVTDGLVVTATGPAAAPQFAEGIVRVLTKASS